MHWERGCCGGIPKALLCALAQPLCPPGDTALSLWLGNVTRCPLGTQLQLLGRCVQNGQGMEVGEGRGGEREALARGPWARS